MSAEPATTVYPPVGTDDALSIVHAQYEATGTIYGSNNPVEILKSFNSFVRNQFERSHLALIQDPNQPSTLRLIAAQDREGARLIDGSARLEDYPAYEALSALEALSIQDVDSDTFLTEAERDTLRRRGVRSMIVVPLVVNQRLTGLISFTHSEVCVLSPARLRALRGLADQFAIVLENRELLQSTAASLEEVRALYNINRALLGAQDVLDVLRVLRDDLAQDATWIGRIDLIWDSQQRIEEILLTHTIAADGEKVVNVSLMTTVDGVALAAFDAAQSSSERSLALQGGVDQAYAAHPLVNFVRSQGGGSHISFYLRERGIFEDVIVVIFKTPRVFDERARRLHQAIADQMTIVLQNQRLLRDAQQAADQLARQVRVLEILNQLSTSISGLSDEPTLLDRSIEGIVEALDVDHGSLVLLEAGGEIGIVVSEYPERGSLGARLDAKKDRISELISTERRPLLMTNPAADPRLSKESQEAFVKMGVSSALVLSLVVQGKVIGSVELDLYNPERQFTQEMIEVAQTITAQVALSLQNIRLLSDAQRRAEQLQRIAAFAQSVQATLDLSAVLNIMLVESAQMIQLDKLSIAFYDPKMDMLRIVAQYENDRTFVNLNSGQYLSLNSDFVGQVWQTRELLYIPDLDAAGVRRIASDQTRSLLITPIRSRGRVLGTVQVGSLRPQTYSEADIALFQQMISQLAVALENAEAFAQSQRQAKNEALVNDISVQYQQQHDIQQMLNITMSELGKALGARRARIRLATQPDNE